MLGLPYVDTYKIKKVGSTIDFTLNWLPNDKILQLEWDRVNDSCNIIIELKFWEYIVLIWRNRQWLKFSINIKNPRLI